MAKADRYAEAEEANRLKGGREANFANKTRAEEPVKKKGTSPLVGKKPLNKGKRPVINVIFGGWSPTGTKEEYAGSVEEPHVPRKQRQESITFSDSDLSGKGIQSHDALVISMGINGTEVRRILVDTGSSVNIMYYDVFVKLGFAHYQLRQVKTPLVGFTGILLRPRNPYGYLWS
nr:uncharacterized protein LOC109183154 [Ipomoea batatas]